MEAFWNTLGRMFVDSDFFEGLLGRRERKAVPADQNAEVFTQRVNALPRQRLSRFEVFELLRLLKLQEFIDAAVELGRIIAGSAVPRPSDELRKLYGLLCIDHKLRDRIIRSNDPTLAFLRAEHHFDLGAEESKALYAVLTEADSPAVKSMKRIDTCWTSSCAPALVFARGYKHCDFGTVRGREV